jgi:hypothetical protein
MEEQLEVPTSEAPNSKDEIVSDPFSFISCPAQFFSCTPVSYSVFASQGSQEIPETTWKECSGTSLSVWSGSPMGWIL